MVAELISVGTELLLGNIVNTNASFLAEQCAGLGLSLYFQTVVGDNPGRLEQTLRLALSRADVVILTGGLGPTKDDLTKELVADLTGCPLVEHEHTREQIQRFFDTRKVNADQITENNWKQALIPDGATVVDNANGTAPGLIVPHKEQYIILLPGPPKEMEPMFLEGVAPFLRALEPAVIYSKTVRVCGMGESRVETMIADLVNAQDNPTIATYAKTGCVDMRVTASASSEQEAKQLVRPVVCELQNRFGTHVYSTDEKETLEEAVVSMLRDRGLTVSTAESCTGGLLAARLVNVSGASQVFAEGYITYSNEAKTKLLGVPQDVLRQFGAVSEQTARAMAFGAAAAAGSDASVAITGIAGPLGGSDAKPVGTVFIACSVNGSVSVQEYHFDGNREKIRDYSAVSALTLLRNCILDGE